MKGIYLAGLVAACCLAAGLVTTGSSGDRELRELSKRIDKLEQSQSELSQAMSRLAKSVADLEKSVRSSKGPEGNLRDESSRADQQDNRLAEIEKRLGELSKAVNDLQKQVGPRGDLVTAINKKIDERTVHLAKWFDQYHAKSISSFHRDEIERIR